MFSSEFTAEGMGCIPDCLHLKVVRNIPTTTKASIHAKNQVTHSAMPMPRDLLHTAQVRSESRTVTQVLVNDLGTSIN